ncbi:MAG: sigma-70 family RNA polymerase sigma factor [Asticcacaulis sp.]
MRAAQGGDAEAYRALLMALRPWLSAYFRRRLQSPDTEDLVQITLISVHEKRHTYDATAPFLPWLAAVARHKLIDYVRRHRRYVHVALDDHETSDESGFDLPASLARRDVQALLSQLPPEQARIIRLNKVEELSLDEVSKLSGRSVNALKVTIHRGLKTLREAVSGRAAVSGSAKAYDDE